MEHTDGATLSDPGAGSSPEAQPRAIQIVTRSEVLVRPRSIGAINLEEDSELLLELVHNGTVPALRVASLADSGSEEFLNFASRLVDSSPEPDLVELLDRKLQWGDGGAIWGPRSQWLSNQARRIDRFLATAEIGNAARNWLVQASHNLQTSSQEYEEAEAVQDLDVN